MMPEATVMTRAARGSFSSGNGPVEDWSTRADPDLLAAYAASAAPAPFSAIVARHSAMVCRTALRILGNAQDAEDVSQAVFLALAARPWKVRHCLAGWLHEAARGTAIQMLRSRTRRARREASMVNVRQGQTADSEGALREELDAALAELPATLRETVVCRYLEGHDQNETARLIGCPQGTVATRSAKGLVRLRSILARRGTVVTAAALLSFLTSEARAAALPGGAGLRQLAGLAGTSFTQAAGWAKLKTCVVALGAMLAVATAAYFTFPGFRGRPTFPGSSVTLRSTTGPVYSVALAADGETLASAGEDGRVTLWDLRSVKERAIFRADATSVYSVQFAADDGLLATGGYDGNVKLWDPKTGLIRFVLPGHEVPVRCIAFAPTGRLLASAGHDGTIRLWDLATQEQRRVLVGHAHWVKCLVFTPDGKSLVSGGYDEKIRIWDVASGAERVCLYGPPGVVAALAIAPDGRHLAAAHAGEASGEVSLWDMTGRRLSAPRQPLFKALTIAFSPDSRVLVAGGADGTMRAWEARTGWPSSAPLGHEDSVYSATFSVEGGLLITCSRDATIKFQSLIRSP